ncbi:hypothetical protein FB45DRAFT_1069463 [Roridomyces roridus]|uniref:Uncharacterized protein n=1 Tax=Roridomyces roridus TaxID=1738132 RepID=A0AAD7F6M9_9AGAR|nr:hypothetical protein FB45DRAFT_1069463 [Roridomyces roridus]
MANHLPDEILAEILSPALKVPDEVFSDNSQDSPFAQYSESSSAFLLVSKAWLRVSTPLLYHVVVLRSTAQAAALERALKMNPELGRFIRKLRLEGGYGAPMSKIIQAAPNVTDLFLTLSIWSNDNPNGLVRGLPSMDPHHVVLFDKSNIRFNKNSQLVHDAFIKCLGIWKNLSIVDVPCNHYAPSWHELVLLKAIKNTPNLTTVIVSPIFSTWSKEIPTSLTVIAQNQSLSAIQLKTRDPAVYFQHAAILTDPSLRGLIKMPEITLDDDSPHNSPLQFSTAAVPEHIWDRILSFCMVLEFDDKDPWHRAKARIPILLVSKLFARLALPHYYDNLNFRQPARFKEFVTRIRTQHLCSRVRTLYLNPENPKRAKFDLSLALPKIRLVNIIGRNGDPLYCIDFQVFENLGKYSGPTLVRLEGFEVVKASSPQNPAVFNLFSHLRSLFIGCRAAIDVSDPATVPSGALPNLEELTLAHVHQSVVLALAQIDLPALRSTSFTCSTNPGPFFEKHGNRLRSAGVWVTDIDLDTMNVFDLCPRMVEFTLFCGKNVPNPVRFTCNPPHAFLKNMTFKTTGGQSRAREKEWEPFLTKLKVGTFSALEQILLPTIHWPTTQAEIQKSVWVGPAERLLSDYGVKLTDAAGVGWRKRLKV